MTNSQVRKEAEAATLIKTNLLREAKRKDGLEAMMSLQPEVSEAKDSKTLMNSPIAAANEAVSMTKTNSQPSANTTSASILTHSFL